MAGIQIGPAVGAGPPGVPAYAYLSTETDEKDLARPVGERVYGFEINLPLFYLKACRG